MPLNLLLVHSSSQIPDAITAAVKFVGKPVHEKKKLYPFLEPIETPPLVSDS